MKRRNKYLKTIILTLFLNYSFILISQNEHHDVKYFPESDTSVLNKIEEWQDLKFGLLMHWGPYSQWGIVESWSICPEEYGWCERKMGSNPNNYNKYVYEYENLKTTFNPKDFNPEKWALAAQNAGMKYVIFTTKHHDGFCMYDSKYTDYKITDSLCPFSTNPRSDIAYEIFTEFRKKGLWTGVYFSKPDWHSDYYWDPYYPPRDRNVNYEPEENPENWNKFTEYTHNQILELLTNYGDIDILWLDGGWVAKQTKDEISNWYSNSLKNNESGYLKHRIVNQDIKMDSLVKKARKLQPGLIVVDRAVPGVNQNYLTPENRIPNEPLPYPWESCIISGGGWSHTKNAKYMSTRQALITLVEIVSKGGNLLLNIAPTPEGDWQEGAYKLLTGIGEWMQINNEAIYNTKPMYPYQDGNIYFTRGKNNDVFMFYLLSENQTELPEEISISSFIPNKSASIEVIGANAKIKWKTTGNQTIIHIPNKIGMHPPSENFVVFKISN